MRVVLDVNVLISAVISPQGSPAKILDLWKQDRFDLVTSALILEELARVIHYPKIQERYNLPEEHVEQFLQLIASGAITVRPSSELSVIKEDPSDNRYLECAAAAGAAYIVTGDTHLLKLKEYKGVVTLTPAEFLALLEWGK